MFILDSWSLYGNTENNDHLIKWSLCKRFLKKSACQIWREKYLGRNQPFTKFVEAANNFTKLKGLANNFWEVRKTRKNFMKFVDWKVGFICWKVFLYLSCALLNTLIGKHKCFVNTFHVSWILFINKLNRGCDIGVGKIFATVKKWSLVASDRWSFYAVKILPNITWVDLWRGDRFIEVVFKTGLTVIWKWVSMSLMENHF